MRRERGVRTNDSALRQGREVLAGVAIVLQPAAAVLGRSNSPRRWRQWAAVLRLQLVGSLWSECGRWVGHGQPEVGRQALHQAAHMHVLFLSGNGCWGDSTSSMEHVKGRRSKGWGAREGQPRLPEPLREAHAGVARALADEKSGVGAQARVGQRAGGPSAAALTVGAARRLPDRHGINGPNDKGAAGRAVRGRKRGAAVRRWCGGVGARQALHAGRRMHGLLSNMTGCNKCSAGQRAY